MSKELITCELCNETYKPCKYNYSRQKYCTSTVCKRQRKKLSNQRFRSKHPDYDRERYRISQIPNSSESKPAADEKVTQKRVLVNTSMINELSQVFERYMSTLVGMAIRWSGGLAQASAFWVREFLDSCYENGRSLLETSSLHNNVLEKFYEFSNQITQPSP